MSIQSTIKTLEKSQVEIKAIIPAKTFDGYRPQALEAIGKTAKIDGFRQGKVPQEVLEQKVGLGNIIDEMAQLAISDAYPKLLAEHSIAAIGRPQITITKAAPGNDLEFAVITAVLPSITLPDYKKIAQGLPRDTNNTVSDEEINAALLEVRQMRAHQKMHEDGVEHHDHDHTKIDPKDLPELTDEEIKKLGKFENLDDFKAKLRENLGKEKELKAKEKNRIELIEKIIGASSIDLPDMLVDFELDKMMQQFAHDIAMMGMTIEDYMKKLDKTESQLKTEWRTSAEKRAKMQFILDEIASKEKIVPDETELTAEVEKIMSMYKDQKDISEDRARAYVTQIMTNAKVFEFLEGIK